MVGVYNPSTIQGSLDSSSIDCLSKYSAIDNPPSETTFDCSSWVFEPLIAICDILPLLIGEIQILPVDTTITDPAITDSYTEPYVYTDYIDPVVDTGIVSTDTPIDLTDDTNLSADPTVIDPIVVENTDIFYLTTDPILAIDPIYISDPIVDTGTIETDTRIESSDVTNESTDPSTIGYLTNNNESDQPIEKSISTDIIFTIDPFVVTDPISDSGIITDSPKVIYDLTDSNIDTSTDPAITKTPVYKDDSINSILLIPTASDSSTATPLNDLSLVLSPITDSSIFTTAKAKK